MLFFASAGSTATEQMVAHPRPWSAWSKRGPRTWSALEHAMLPIPSEQLNMCLFNVQNASETEEKSEQFKGSRKWKVLCLASTRLVTEPLLQLCANGSLNITPTCLTGNCTKLWFRRSHALHFPGPAVVSIMERRMT